MESFAILSIYWLNIATAQESTTYRPNSYIMSPTQCAARTCVPTETTVCCPAFHDGLSCWNFGSPYFTRAYSPLDIYNASVNYKPMYQHCPTITNQVTSKTMRKYCSTKTSQWVNPKTMQPDQDYIEDADCYLGGQSPNLEERKKLYALTQALKLEAFICERYKNYKSNAEATKFQYSPTWQQRLAIEWNFTFDGVMCISSSESYRPYCPLDDDFYKTNTTGGARYVRDYLANMTTEAEYSQGWRACLRDDYKQLLTKYGLDQYFREGCSPFKNDYVDLPFTKVNQYASSPCNRTVSDDAIVTKEQSPMLDLTKQASFYCNAQRQWEGIQQPLLNKGCFKTEIRDMVTELQGFVPVTCPAIKDKVVGEWPETEAGQNATALCQPLFHLYLQLNDNENRPHYMFREFVSANPKYAFKRLCGSDGKWAPVNYFKCFEQQRDRDRLMDMVKQIGVNG